MTKEEIRDLPYSVVGDTVARDIYKHRRNIIKPDALASMVVNKYTPEQQVLYLRALSWLLFATFAIQEDHYSTFKLISADATTKLRAALIVHHSQVPTV